MQLTSAVHPVFITREKESLVADSNRAAVRLETHAQKQVSFCGHKVFLRLLEERKHLGGSSPLTGAGESLSVCGHKVSLRSGPVPVCSDTGPLFNLKPSKVSLLADTAVCSAPPEAQPL